jgi:hypothetical protein
MKIIITERQLKVLREQTEVPNSKPAVMIATAINRATKGMGTDEKSFYDQITKIKDQNTLNLVIEILKNGYNKDFYGLINSEFGTPEKEKIKDFLNANNLNHNIVDDKILPVSIKSTINDKNKDTTKSNIVSKTLPNGVKMEPSVLGKKSVQDKKPKNLSDAIKNDLDFRRKVVAATLIGEAGGESDPRSLQAVLSVLQNRTKGGEIKMAEAALDPKDFSMWNDIPRTLEAINKKIESYENHSKWNEAYNLVKKPVKDITHGATHYYVYQGESKADPYWKDKLKSTIYPAIVNPDNPINTINPKKKTPCKGIGCFLRIGNHLFGKTPF